MKRLLCAFSVKKAVPARRDNLRNCLLPLICLSLCCVATSKETTCVLIDDLEIRLPLNAASSVKTSFDLSSLIEQGDLKDVRE